MGETHAWFPHSCCARLRHKKGDNNKDRGRSYLESQQGHKAEHRADDNEGCHHGQNVVPNGTLHEPVRGEHLPVNQSINQSPATQE